MVEKDYSKLLEGINDIREAARDKGLAKLGDEIINMVYSLAYSLHVGYATGEKINKTVLSEAMRMTKLRPLAKHRAKAHDIADSAEALVAYVFLRGKMDTGVMIDYMINGFNTQDHLPETVKDKRETDIAGLFELFLKIKYAFADEINALDW